MRYILDEYGYIEEVTFGAYIECKNKSCTEYIGEIPGGYDSLEEWSETSNIRAYKIVDNNLAYDENKDKELQAKYEIEAEENENATHKWVRSQLGKNSSLVIDEFSYNASGNSLVLIDDSGAYEIPSLQVFSDVINKCNILVSNKNLLGIDTLTQTINGVTITINEDKTITLNGTAKENIELNLKGTSNSLDMLFLFVKDTNYVSSGFLEGTSLNLYNFDGNDRTLIGTLQNEVINLSNTYKVTQTTLYILSGTKFNNVTIKPQLEINDVPTDYVKHEENKVEAKLYDNNATIYDLYSYNPVSIIMTDEEVDIELQYFKSKTLQEQFSKIETKSNEIVLSVSSINNKVDILGTNIDDITGEITSVKTGKGFTFNDEGLYIDDPNEEFYTHITNRATQYKNGDEVITETSKDGFMTTDLKEKGTHQYSYDKENDTYDMVAERIEVEGEYAYAHFYNGGDW